MNTTKDSELLLLLLSLLLLLRGSFRVDGFRRDPSVMITFGTNKRGVQTLHTIIRQKCETGVTMLIRLSARYESIVVFCHFLLLILIQKLSHRIIDL